MKLERTIAALLLTSLTGCSLAPDYNRPAMPPVGAYKESGDWLPAQPADELDRGPWWKLFNDPTLDALEDKVTSSNQNLKAALARYDEAKADVGVARADFFPQITGNANSERFKLSKTVANAAPSGLYYDHTLGLDMSYELDVWGKVRNEVSASESAASASAADAATMDLSLHAELAMDYFTLRGEDAAQKVLDQTVIAYQKALELTQNLHAGGAAAEADVDQARTQLENAKTQAADTHLKRAQLEHAIAVLTGQMPSSFSLAVENFNMNAPVVNPGLPSTLLERRPDVASAERLAAAANANIGVARAAYFPDLNLGAEAGVQSALLSKLFTAPSLFWAFGPSLAQTIFDGGRISSLSDKAHAQYDEAVANYRQTVLSAYQQVEDSLIMVRQLAVEQQTQTAATTAAERALKQSELLYKGGITTYLQVVIAQNTALQAELASVDVTVRQLNSSVILIKALGGGWKLNNGEVPEPAAAKPATEEPKAPMDAVPAANPAPITPLVDPATPAMP